MKRILLALVVIGAVSCSKENKEGCYQCTINRKIEWKHSGVKTDKNYVNADTCWITDEKIRAYELSETYSGEGYNYDTKDTNFTVQTMTCKRK